MAVLNWGEAKERIEEAVAAGCALGRNGASRREVVEVNHACNRHGYGGERGFAVRIGVTSTETIDIPWSMLETCYDELLAGAYAGSTFRHHYPHQARVHPCHVHVVGMMFVRAGLATSNGQKQARYTPVSTPALSPVTAGSVDTKGDR